MLAMYSRIMLTMKMASAVTWSLPGSAAAFTRRGKAEKNASTMPMKWGDGAAGIFYVEFHSDALLLEIIAAICSFENYI